MQVVVFYQFIYTDNCTLSERLVGCQYVDNYRQAKNGFLHVKSLVGNACRLSVTCRLLSLPPEFQVFSNV